METVDLKGRLSKLVEPIVLKFGLDLVDIELKGSKNNLVAQIFVDAEGGVLLDDCARLSQAISDELDTHDPIPGKFRLEVSSPGIDRPLRTSRDFQRNRGRSLTLQYKDGNEVSQLEGRITEVDEHQIEIATQTGKKRIEFENVILGKLKLSFNH